MASHGYSHTNIYQVWTHMLYRCRNPRAKQYPDYGGRGITVCERWMLFENFLADMGERPKGLSLDRLNNDGNYEPGNCRWATNIQQMRNRRTTRFLEIDGEIKTLIEWCSIYSVPYFVACDWWRHRPREELIKRLQEFSKRPFCQQKNTRIGIVFEIYGETKGLLEWADYFGIKRTTVQSWKRRLSDDEVIKRLKRGSCDPRYAVYG